MGKGGGCLFGRKTLNLEKIMIMNGKEVRVGASLLVGNRMILVYA